LYSTPTTKATDTTCVDMADRRNLRDKAKSAGKSVAGTLKQGAQTLKDKATAIAKDDETGITISEVQGQYLVIDSDGSAIGPYDDKMKAAAKARQLKQEKQSTSERRESRSEGMEETNDSSDQSTGKVQRAATRFSSGVNKAVSTAASKASNVDPVDEPMGANKESTPQLDDLFGGSMDGDGPSLDMFEGGGKSPTLPFADDGGDNPQLPFGNNGEADMGMLPFGGSEGEPSMPAFGGEGEIGDLPFGDGEDTDEPELRF